MKDDIPCIHLFIYRMFKEKVNGRIYIPFHLVREIMRRRLHKIPRVLHYEILKEMENYNLIRRIGSDNGKNIIFELTGKDKEKILNQYNLPI